MKLDRIFKNNEACIRERTAVVSCYFEKMSKGQKIRYLCIRSYDSLAGTEKIMGFERNDVFVFHIYAGVKVNIDLNAMTAFNYATCQLKLKLIKIGRYCFCRNVKATIQINNPGIRNPSMPNIKFI